MPSFACKDLGMSCTFQTSADTEEELMKKIADHAGKVHNMKTITPDLMQKIKNVIKKESKT